MIRLSSTGVLFEVGVLLLPDAPKPNPFFKRDDPETDEALVGYCWIDDGSDAYLDEQDGPENTLAPPDSDSSSSSSDSSDS
ncbi:hypothetical protein FRC18_005437 [Serendipita sp. 400]|nr:hypothetical protein FRC18_005437 [Serendipita sp. 400]